MEYVCKLDSPLGTITLSSDGLSLTGLWFEGQKYFAATLSPDAEARALPVFDETARWLERYFAGQDPGSPPRLQPSGSEYRRRVWDQLIKIPYGQTICYGEIAAKLGSAARAVGSAVGRNPISILIPCHRVVGADGSLTGYAGGMDRKVRLLALEGADMAGTDR